MKTDVIKTHQRTLIIKKIRKKGKENEVHVAYFGVIDRDTV